MRKKTHRLPQLPPWTLHLFLAMLELDAARIQVVVVLFAAVLACYLAQAHHTMHIFRFTNVVLVDAQGHVRHSLIVRQFMHVELALELHDEGYGQGLASTDDVPMEVALMAPHERSAQ